MPRRPRLFAPGLLYHVVARGNHRQPTFLTDGDYDAYLTRLATYRRRYGVTLYAYCLMPNHVHLLLEMSDAPLSRFMQGLQQSYTQRFNRVHGKVGHLFQGRYKAIVCDRDEYFITLTRYIHLNPVRAGLVDRPEAYPYSGHREYLRGRPPTLVDARLVLTLLGGRKAYRRFVLAGIGESHDESHYRTAEQPSLAVRPSAQSAGQGAQPARGRTLPLPRLLDELAAELPFDSGTLRSSDRSRAINGARAVLSFVLVRRFGYRVVDVASALGRDSASVGMMVLRLAKRLEVDSSLVAEVERVSGKCWEVRV